MKTALDTVPTCNASVEGAIYYNKTDKRFWGCDGATWYQLDNRDVLR